ncbi:hypothetical protein D3C73_1587490 [compost metagenome]
MNIEGGRLLCILKTSILLLGNEKEGMTDGKAPYCGRSHTHDTRDTDCCLVFVHPAIENVGFELFQN